MVPWLNSLTDESTDSATNFWKGLAVNIKKKFTVWQYNNALAIVMKEGVQTLTW